MKLPETTALLIAAGLVLACQSGTRNVSSADPKLDASGGQAGDAGDAGAGDSEVDSLWSQCDHAEVQENCRDGWCEIPAGCFVMGSPESEWGRALVQEDQVLVTLTRGFVIQQTEVTQADWTSHGFTYPSGSETAGPRDCSEDPECPVGRISWFEAVAYANFLSEKHNPPLEPCYVVHGCRGEIGSDYYCEAAEVTKPTVYECEGFRLPTNAEWEYAARAGTRTTFYSGDITVHDDFADDPTACLPDVNLQPVAWYCFNSSNSSHPVAQRRKNDWGLFDMLGNAEEWNNDRADGRPATQATDPGGTVGLHSTRNTRGGSFVSWAKICRTAARIGPNWNQRRIGLGFRLVRTGSLEDL